MHDDEHIPVFKRWSGWYWLLIGVLVVQIGLFYFLTVSFP